MQSLNRRMILVLWMVTLLAGCQQAPAPSGKADTSWPAFVEAFLQGYFELNPTFAVYQGKHEFDGKLPDCSEAGLKRGVSWLEEKKARAEAYADAALHAPHRVERDHLIQQIRGDLFWRQTADYPHRNPYFYSDLLDPDVYVSRDYAPLAQRLEAYLRYARAVPAALAQIRENLRGPLAPEHIAIGIRTIGGLAEFYEQDVPKVFEPALSPARRAEFDAVNGGAIKAVREFAAWLGERSKTATASFALGAANFRLMLRETEGVDVSLAELEAIGRRDMERNLRALQEACAKFAPGKTIDEAVALANARKPEGSVIAIATQQLAELKRFVVQQNMVSVPGTEEAKVAQAPAYKAWNFAYINIPGPYERGLPSIYYVSPPDPTWSKQKQDDYVPGIGSLWFTSAHEVWPGHFLQFLHANRASSQIGRVFVGYAFAEGWAHYTEELMWEAGLGDNSPEMHIGQLTEALLRDARFLSAIGLHARGMTLGQSIALFREQAHQDEGTAEQQAKRGTFDPAYINYTMGKLMIRKLRDDWTATRGGRAAWRVFHDEFLRYGGPPIPLVRKAMMGEPGALF